jgi:hypothetical protein
MPKEIGSLDVQAFIEAQATIKTELIILGEFFQRSGYNKAPFVSELIKLVKSELGIKLQEVK